MAESGPPILFRREGAVGWIVLSRPAKRNALDRAMLSGLATLLREAENDASLRVLALTGAGAAFCAGADLAEVSGEGRDTYLDLLAVTLDAARRFSRPLVGVLNGTTVAGGLELALCCDLLLAAESARIGDGHIVFGLIPGAGSATLLPDRVGPARARQMLFTGALETASTLRDWGLVNWVVPDDALQARADAILGQLARLSPVALAAMKRLTRSETSVAISREHAAMRAHLVTADAVEGLAAFRDKRAPRFGDAP